MRIGIDISQIAYGGTGVGNYVEWLVENLLKVDNENEYILFYSSMRRRIQNSKFPDFIGIPNGKDHRDKIQSYNSKVKIKTFLFPPTFLDILWNKMHILPIECFIGDVDVFISSDWTQPPTRKAKSMTILYDLIIYKYPQETAKKIVDTQNRRLVWVKKECDQVICISEATKRDAIKILGIDEKKMTVVYPGI